MKKRIAKIYDLLSRIPVNGDSVDVMAAVRADLRIIHNQLNEQEKHKHKQQIEQPTEQEEPKQGSHAETVEENA